MTTSRAELHQRNSELHGIVARQRGEMDAARVELRKLRRRVGKFSQVQTRADALRQELRPMKYAKRRFDIVAAELDAARRRIAELKATARASYEAGSRAAIVSTYMSLADDFGMPGVSWLSNRLTAFHKRFPVPSVEIDAAITESVIQFMRSYDPGRAAELDRAFADFLASGEVRAAS